MSVLLKGQGLYKRYKRGNQYIEPLKTLDIELRENEILGVVGESGSGKSTLLKVISGIESPNSGKLFYRGEDYTGRNVGYVGRFMRMIFQDAYGSFDPHIRMRKALKETQPGITDSEIEDIVRAVGLPLEVLSKYPSELSGGQCQRMAIARALLAKAEVLLCDEITSALDVTSQAQVVELLKKLQEQIGFAVIFVSHDIALVSELCERVIVMKNGNIVEQGVTRDVVSCPKDDYTKLLIDCVL